MCNNNVLKLEFGDGCTSPYLLKATGLHYINCTSVKPGLGKEIRSNSRSKARQCWLSSSSEAPEVAGEVGWLLGQVSASCAPGGSGATPPQAAASTTCLPGLRLCLQFRPRCSCGTCREPPRPWRTPRLPAVLPESPNLTSCTFPAFLPVGVSVD